MIEIIKKQNCCGCTACAQKCPKQCITMSMDEEGFLYPIVDRSSCINCNLCMKVCPIINRIEIPKNMQSCYLVQNSNEEERYQSASGGFFSPMAKLILSEGGVVFGAVFDNNMELVHSYTTDINQLVRFRGSKYLQSNMRDSYSKVKYFLGLQKKVLFSGTPCQIHGLLSYLGYQDVKNLITLDFVCHGVPSPGLFKKYIRFMEKEQQSSVVSYTSRNKRLGYSTRDSFFAHCLFANGTDIYADTDHPYVNFMNKAFFAEISSRPACHFCAFKGKKHISDFTIYDSWNTKELCKEDNKGTTILLMNSDVAKIYFNKIQDEMRVQAIRVKDLLRFDTTSMFYSMIPNPQRRGFFEDASYLSIPELYDKYLNYAPITPSLTRKYLKCFLEFSGLIYLARKLKYKINRSETLF